MLVNNCNMFGVGLTIWQVLLFPFTRLKSFMMNVFVHSCRYCIAFCEWTPYHSVSCIQLTLIILVYRVFSFPINILTIVRIRVLYLIIFIKSEVWPVSHCLGVRSWNNTMRCLPFYILINVCDVKTVGHYERFYKNNKLNLTQQITCFDITTILLHEYRECNTQKQRQGQVQSDFLMTSCLHVAAWLWHSRISLRKRQLIRHQWQVLELMLAKLQTCRLFLRWDI